VGAVAPKNKKYHHSVFEKSLVNLHKSFSENRTKFVSIYAQRFCTLLRNKVISMNFLLLLPVFSLLIIALTLLPLHSLEFCA
jgi:hypothetical protein